MKLRLLAASIAALSFASLPAYGGFKMIENGTEARPQGRAAPARPAPKSSFGTYKILEVVDGDVVDAALPSVRQQESISSALTAAEPVYAQGGRSDGRLSASQLQAESLRLQAQIERLRADLALVQQELLAVQNEQRPPVQRMGPINVTLDRLEQRMAEVGTVMLRVNFGLNSTKFTPSDEAGAALVAAGKRASQVTIYGHADNTGTAERNRTVAMARANSAKKYMVANGISAAKIIVISRGATEPVADNETESGRAKNRHVDVELRR